VVCSCVFTSGIALDVTRLRRCCYALNAPTPTLTAATANLATTTSSSSRNCSQCNTSHWTRSASRPRRTGDRHSPLGRGFRSARGPNFEVHAHGTSSRKPAGRAHRHPNSDGAWVVGGVDLSQPGNWAVTIDAGLGDKGRLMLKAPTGIDATTPQRALQIAPAAIDGGAFSRQPADRRTARGHRHRRAS